MTYRLEYAETARRDLREIGNHIHRAAGEVIAGGEGNQEFLIGAESR